LALRFAIGRWISGLPFLTFFPAVLIASLLLGWRWGLAVTLASAVAANFFFVEPRFQWLPSTADVVGMLAFFTSASLLVITAAALRASVKEIADIAEREANLNMELQHRVKNNLAVVQGLARQTAKSATHPDEFYRAFIGRLVALGEAHNVLSSGNWEECRLPDLAQAALGPFQQHGAITLDGQACAIPSESCVPLVLALHELGTNAIKYGALSAPSGHVSLTWTVTNGNALLRWRETGGPEVLPPTRRGLGSRLLRRQPGLDAVTLEYRTEGVICEIGIGRARLAE
jgi:two-component sensor histidine kinase